MYVSLGLPQEIDCLIVVVELCVVEGCPSPVVCGCEAGPIRQQLLNVECPVEGCCFHQGSGPVGIWLVPVRPIYLAQLEMFPSVQDDGFVDDGVATGWHNHLVAVYFLLLEGFGEGLSHGVPDHLPKLIFLSHHARTIWGTPISPSLITYWATFSVLAPWAPIYIC